MDDLLTLQPIEGRAFPDFAMLDAKIASALKRDHHESVIPKN